jgi:hypothetical protein
LGRSCVAADRAVIIPEKLLASIRERILYAPGSVLILGRDGRFRVLRAIVTIGKEIAFSVEALPDDAAPWIGAAPAHGTLTVLSRL